MKGRRGWNLAGDNHPVNRGEQHPSWKGDAARPDTGRQRARALFPLGPCEQCGAAGVDRHHKDDNPLNNDASNVVVLCRKCHMHIDGRAVQFPALGTAGAIVKAAAKDHHCTHCGRDYPQLRKGLCAACDVYRRRHGRPRPLVREPRAEQACLSCGTSCFPHARGLCAHCYDRLRNTGRKR